MSISNIISFNLLVYLKIIIWTWIMYTFLYKYIKNEINMRTLNEIDTYNS